MEEVLSQSNWKKLISKKSNTTLEIINAFVVGLFSHIVTLAPWFMVINFVEFSVLFLPIVLILNAIVIKHHQKEAVNTWYYRDHWLAHHQEMDFVYLHGPHHDAIPSGLIGVGGTGFIEGYMRYLVGAPHIYFNPVMNSLMFTLDIYFDIRSHQYIPGVFPGTYMAKFSQHSRHHFGNPEPYGLGIKVNNGDQDAGNLEKMPEGIKNSASLDEQLNGFSWNNKTHQWYLGIVKRYEGNKISNIKTERSSS